MAKVWQLTSGHLSNLRLNEIDLQVPAKEDDILIQVAYSGLNFADIFACLGLYSATPKGLFTPGLEFSGVVVQVHENNRHNFKIVFYKINILSFMHSLTRHAGRSCNGSDALRWVQYPSANN